MFETTSQFSFKLCNIIQCHERDNSSVLFLAEPVYHLDKWSAKSTVNCSREISPNLYFDRLLLSKVYKISAKKVTRKTDLLFQKGQDFSEF